MLDTDGDGMVDTRQDELSPVQPVYWKIAEW
jgi:hypothetical protein